MRDSDDVLRETLRTLPVPELSPDFDARVLAGLRDARPWWHRLWEPARPLLAGASFSLVLTLALLHCTLTTPVAAPPQSIVPSLAARPLPPLDALLDRPDLSAGTLAQAWASAPLEAPADRRPAPRRHAQLPPRVTLIV